MALYGVLALPAGSAEFAIANATFGVTVTIAEAEELALDVLVAVTVTEVFAVTFGATKAPVLVIVPALADQVTAVSAVPLNCAVNCCGACEAIFALLGEMESVPSEWLAETTMRAETDPFSSRGTYPFTLKLGMYAYSERLITKVTKL